MKLIDVDKLKEILHNDKQLSSYNGMPKEVYDRLINIIDDNSVEVDIIIPQGIVEINDKIMEREYDNYLDAIYISKKKEVL